MVDSSENNPSNQIILGTIIYNKLRNTVLENKKNKADNYQIQIFFKSKTKLFQPELSSNKNNLKYKIMNSEEVLNVREEFGLTQQKFADLVGVDRRTVANWENGKKIPASKIKLFDFLLDKKKNSAIENTFVEKVESTTTIQTFDNLNREIFELKDHIKTLKDFLEEKNILADMYKREIMHLKEKLSSATNIEDSVKRL